MLSGNKGRRLSTVETTLEIIDAIHELDGARVSELGEHLDTPPSTIQGHLNTLTAHGYLVKEGDFYQIGMQFLAKGGYARRRKRAYDIASKKVEELTDVTEERVQFIVNEHGRGFYLHTDTGAHAVQVDARIGKVTHLHASAAGKAILAHMPDSYVDEFVDVRGLLSLTENTITEKEALLTELEDIRERGTSFNKEESIEGLRAVGVPVLDRSGGPIGGLSVSGPSNRMKGEWFESEIPDLLLGAANEIELKTAYPE